ncbi:adenylate/guanylate cyclase domain-containing protein [soil metagenome]
MSQNENSGAIHAAMERLEAQRAVLGDEAVDLALAALGRQLDECELPAPAPPPPKDAREEGERKLVTVMFADVSGFTQLAADLDPEEVRDLMNRCFDRLVPVVSRYEGTVDKFVGDAIVALFGAPVAHEDDAMRALSAARDMQAALVEFNREHRTDLGLHFGINSGTVVAGHVGALGRQDYSVMGDAVNMAARLEDISERGEILVGHDTFRLTAAAFDFDSLSEVRVKGKGDPILVYRLRGPKEAPALSREIPRRRPLVGRGEELARLDRAVARLEQGAGGRIAIVSEAGLGKSRLVAQVRQSVGRGIRWAEGRGLSYAQGLSYGVARGLLCSLLGVRADGVGEDLAGSLRDAVDRIAPEDSGEITPYLAALLDLELDDERMAEKVRYLSGELLKQQIAAAFRDFLRRGASGTPMVLVWEDLHWADASSLELLEGLFDLPDEVPILFVLVFRSEPGRMLELHRRFAEGHGERYEVVELAGLNETESQKLVEEYLGEVDLPPNARALVLEKAEGNPLFLEELLHSLVDAGPAAREGERAAAPDVERLEVPDTLQGVIAARIDRLAAADKRTLQAASVIGRIFQRRVLGHLIREVEPHLDGSLEELARRAFVRPREWGDGGEADTEVVEYIFRHVITHDVSYGTLLLARRRRLHRRVGEAIEALFPEQIDELAGMLGLHFQRAEEHPRAAEYLLRAGDRARAQYANEEALGFYREARAEVARVLAAEPVNRTKWEQAATAMEEGIGDVLARTGRGTEARTAYRAALTRLAQNDRAGRSRVLRRIGSVLVAERSFEDALATVEEAERALGEEPGGDDVAEWRSERNELGLDRTWIHYWRGEWRRILELVDEIRPFLEAHGTPYQRSRLHQALALALMRRDRYTPSDELFESARETHGAGEESENLAQAAHGRFLLGFVHFFARDLETAERHISSGLELSERIGEATIRGRCLTYLIAIRRMKGDVEAVMALASDALKLARQFRMIEYEAAAEGNLAWVAWRREDLDGAMAHGRRALDLWEAYPGPAAYPFQWFARWPLLALAVEAREPEEAAEQARALLDESQQPPPSRVAALLETAIINGGERADMDHLAEAIRSATEMGYL